MADWEELLPELLASIAKRLTSIWDYISFRGVCKPWRSAATFHNFNHALPRVPWLMFTETEENDKGSYVTKFVDLSKNKKIFRISNLAKEDEKSIKHSLYYGGWLLCIVETSVRIFLMHPIMRTRVELPDLDTFPFYSKDFLGSLYFDALEFVISKMVLSGSPTIVSDLVIMVIWGGKRQLGFSRPGDSFWTLMEQWDGSFTDILYHKERLYAIDNRLRVVQCDIHGPNPARIQIISSLPSFDNDVPNYQTCYMVEESSGKFLIVSISFYIVFLCRGFEFDLMDGSHKEIYNLGNKTLFVSHSSSSLCLEGFTWNSVVEPDYIYDVNSGDRYHLGNSIDYPVAFYQPFCSRVGRPTWIVPRF